MSFHYIREPGDEGQILTGDGEAPGVPLSDLLAAGPVPIRPALELVAYLGDLLTIAEEDGVFHGDIKPGCVRVDAAGAVALEGFGEERRGGRAPEGRPVGLATDTYGLGVVLHAALTGEGLGAIPRDRDGHDDAVVDLLLQIDWQQLSDKPWLDDIRSFLCSMLAHSPDERPVPLDVANLMGQVGLQAGGQDISEWAAEAVARGLSGEGRRGGAGFSADEEDLGGPQALSGPMGQGEGLKIRQAASAKGEATAFWSRDRIAAMLADEEEDDVPVRQPFKPSSSVDRSRQSTRDHIPLVASPDRATFYGEDAVDRVAASKLDDGPTLFEPSPVGLDQLGGARPAPPPPMPLPVSGSGGPPPPRDPAPPPVAQGPVAPPPVAQDPYAQVPAAPPPVAQGPYAQPGPYAQGPAPLPPQQAPSSGGALKIGVAVVVVLGLVCALGGGVAAVAAWFGLSDSGEEVDLTGVEDARGGDEGDARDEVDTAAAPEGEEGGEGEEGRDEAASGGSSSSSKGSGSSSSKSSGSSGSSGSTSSGSASSSGKSSGSSSGSSSSGSSGSRSSTSSGSSGRSSSGSSGSSSSGSSSSGSSSSGSSGSASSGSSGSSGGGKAPGEARSVKVTVMGAEATLQCGDGQQAEFVGSTRLTFTDVTTCRIKVGESLGVITVQTDSSFSCSESAGRVSCVQQ